MPNTQSTGEPTSG